MKLGDGFSTVTQILSHDTKRLRLFHRILKSDGTEAATGEQMLLHVDTKAHRATEAAEEVQAALRDLASTHAGLPWPAEAGRGIGMK